MSPRSEATPICSMSFGAGVIFERYRRIRGG
jgi:hypothetical protein